MDLQNNISTHDQINSEPSESEDGNTTIMRKKDEEYVDSLISHLSEGGALSCDLSGTISFLKRLKSSQNRKELIEVDVKPIMGFHKSCGFVATQIELQGYGVICKDGKGKIFIEKL